MTAAPDTVPSHRPPRRPMRRSRSRALLRVEWGKATDTRAARWLIGDHRRSDRARSCWSRCSRSTSIDQTLGAATCSSRARAGDAAAGRGDPDADDRMDAAHRADDVHPGAAAGTRDRCEGRGVAAAGARVGRVRRPWSTVVPSASRPRRDGTSAPTWAPANTIGFVLFVLVNIMMGVAFGALLHNTAASIVLFFVLPTVFGILGRPWTRSAAGSTRRRRSTGCSPASWAGTWPQIPLSTLLWVVVPLVAGLVRTVAARDQVATPASATIAVVGAAARPTR